jgi:hypothetical protein
MLRHIALILMFAVLAPVAARAVERPGLPPEAALEEVSNQDPHGLTWVEINFYSPIRKPVNEAFIARMEKTSKPKLRYFRRVAGFMGALEFRQSIKEQWAKIHQECTRILGNS